MERIEITRTGVKNETELYPPEAKRFIAGVLEVPEQNLFPLPEGKDLYVRMIVEVRNIDQDGIIF